MPLIEKLAEQAFWSDCLPLARKMAAVIALSLALDQATAGEPITGSATDGVLTVEWTYDLDSSSASVEISSTTHFHPALTDLVPENATQLMCEDSPCEIQQCVVCLSAIPCPESALFLGHMDAGDSIKVDFQLPPASWDLTLGKSELIYHYGHTEGLSACAIQSEPAKISGFVTVVPLGSSFNEGDLDKDGDVDLHDYQIFQADFTGPRP